MLKSQVLTTEEFFDPEFVEGFAVLLTIYRSLNLMNEE